jgi:hypothetical protein
VTLKPLTLLDRIGIAWVVAVGLVVLLTAQARPHDFWINNGGFKNPNGGESCCGPGDCGVVAARAVTRFSAGYAIAGEVTYGVAVTGNSVEGPMRTEQINEVVPLEEILPSADGKIWRCRKPDGSRRCFFAPIPPGS